MNKVLYNKYLIYTNANLLYIIDIDNIEITSIIELNNILYINFFEDNIIWAVERENKFNYLNNKRKQKQNNKLIQYVLDKKSLELIKVGERPMTNNIVKYILPLTNEKMLLFVENRKVELLVSKHK